MLLLIKKTSPGINAHSQQGDSYTFFVRDVVPLARKSGRSNGMSSRCWTAEAMGMQGPQLPGAKLGDSSAWDGGTRSVQHADETIVDSTGQDSRPQKATRAVWTGKHGAEHFAQPPAKVPVSKLPFALTKLVSQSYCWLGRFYTNVHQLAQCRLGVHLYSMASWLSGSSMTTPALA